MCKLQDRQGDLFSILLGRPPNGRTSLKTFIKEETDKLEVADHIRAILLEKYEELEKAVLMACMWNLCGIDFSNTTQNMSSFGSDDTFMNPETLVPSVPWSIDALHAEIACIEGDIMFRPSTKTAADAIGGGAPPEGVAPFQHQEETAVSALLVQYMVDSSTDVALNDPDANIKMIYLTKRCFAKLPWEATYEENTADDDKNWAEFLDAFLKENPISEQATSVKERFRKIMFALARVTVNRSINLSMSERTHTIRFDLLTAATAWLDLYNTDEASPTALSFSRACALAIMKVISVEATLEGNGDFAKLELDKAAPAQAGPTSPNQIQTTTLWKKYVDVLKPICEAVGGAWPNTVIPEITGWREFFSGHT